MYKQQQQRAALNNMNYGKCANFGFQLVNKKNLWFYWKKQTFVLLSDIISSSKAACLKRENVIP